MPDDPALHARPMRLSGRIDHALRRLLMRRARVADVERLPGGFSMVSLEGDGLKGVPWTPGQKIQIAMGSALTTRTYTPLDWDALHGSSRILGFAHGVGPGSAWLESVVPGDICDIFGPRASITPPSHDRPVALFGDETSLGLAYALIRSHGHRVFEARFEVTEETAVTGILQSLDLGHAWLTARSPHDDHIARWEPDIIAAAGSGATFVLTGRAAMIQHIRRTLRQHSVPTDRIVTKAYWAAGKTGLD